MFDGKDGKREPLNYHHQVYPKYAIHIQIGAMRPTVDS